MTTDTERRLPRKTPQAATSPDVEDSPTRYRYLVGTVSALETPVTIDRLADAMARWENSTGQATEKSWHDVHEELYLVDLPTLDRVGLLTFDADAGTVTTADREEP